MSERDLTHTHDTAHAASTNANGTDVEPGRRPRAQSMLAPAQPIASGILRKARDANGVADDAEHALGAAANSSGSALPETIQRKFEGSLGTDLSSVRIHTGAESAAAAHAVGARAYTVGQDIHFGDGEYNPSSGAGQHLLAHEVAHTVQQRGGTPARQNKLAVSSPHDAAEHEADRAADAMIVGQSFSVGGAGASIARDPKPVTDRALPFPVDWTAGSGLEIKGTWRGDPVFREWIDDVSVEGAYVAVARDQCKTRFTADWTAAQTNYNLIAGEMDNYRSAALDAEKKGLIGLPVKSAPKDTAAGPAPAPVPQALDRQIGGAALAGRSTTIDNAFKEDGSIGGKHNYNGDALNRDERLKIDGAKDAVANATDAVVACQGTATAKQNSYKARVGELSNELLTLRSLPDIQAKEQLDREIAALNKSAALMGEAITGVAGAGTPNTGLQASSTSLAKVVNTMYWDSEIREVENQIIAINASLASVAKSISINKVEIAKLNVANAAIELKQAHLEYNKAVRTRKEAYQGLSTLMQSAASKSGSTKAEAESVGAGIQAIPAIEYVIESAQRIVQKISPPTWSRNSGIGAALATTATQNAMAGHVADLNVTRRKLQETITTWQQRLTSADQLIKSAR